MQNITAVAINIELSVTLIERADKIEQITTKSSQLAKKLSISAILNPVLIIDTGACEPLLIGDKDDIINLGITV